MFLVLLHHYGVHSEVSHLEVEDSKKPHYLEQLNKVLTSMKSIDAFELSSIEPSAYAANTEQYYREDSCEGRQDLLLEKNAH